MPQTDLKSALRKNKVVFQQPKFEVVFQSRVYLKRGKNQNCKTICQTMPQTDLKSALRKKYGCLPTTKV